MGLRCRATDESERKRDLWDREYGEGACRIYDTRSRGINVLG